MWQFLNDVINQTLSGFGQRLAALGPSLLAMLLILAAGVIAAGAIRVLLRAILPRLGFDRFAQRLGLSALLGQGGITRPPSDVIALFSAWTVLAAFVLLAIGALDLRIATDLVGRVFGYLPNLLIAAAI